MLLGSATHRIPEIRSYTDRSSKEDIIGHRPIPAYSRALLAVGLISLIFFIQHGENQLRRIQKNGVLVAITRETPLAHFSHKSDPDHFERRLVELFARHLGVKSRVNYASTIQELLESVDSDFADVAATGLAVDVDRTPPIRYSRPYITVEEQVVYLSGNDRPKTWDDLEHAHIVIPEGSSYETRLKKQQIKYPHLTFTTEDADTLTLLDRVANGKIEYTMADSLDLAKYQQYYPHLRVGFEAVGEQSLAWGFKPLTHYPGLFVLLEKLKYFNIGVDKLTFLQQRLKKDDSLVNAANHFFSSIEKSGELDWLVDVYYSYLRDFDFVDTNTFHRRIEHTLPIYRSTFKAAADDVFDWQLLAALAYQESHWNPDAQSPTGVRGMMMLTKAAAKEVNLHNRLDPVQSIHAGKEYLSRIYEKLPEEITGEDRIWIALASYNIGPAHISDVRKWIAQANGDPNRWQDIREWLPKKTQATWHSKSKHGYARGNEAVKYVENIRAYYEILQGLMLKQGKE